jgi:rubrerythrin
MPFINGTENSIERDDSWFCPVCGYESCDNGLSEVECWMCDTILTVEVSFTIKQKDKNEKAI